MKLLYARIRRYFRKEDANTQRVVDAWVNLLKHAEKSVNSKAEDEYEEAMNSGDALRRKDE